VDEEYLFINLQKVVFLRVVAALVVIGASFWAVFNIRQYRDLIPWIQIPPPQMSLQELVLFVVLVALLWLVVGILTWWYDLRRVSKPKLVTLRKTWLVWFVLISFLAFFGKDFLFRSGISRLVLLWWALFAWVGILLVEWLIFTLTWGRRHKLAAIVFDPVVGQKLEQKFQSNILKVDGSQWKNLDKNRLAGIIIAGDPPLDELQEIIDAFRDKEIYHLSSASLVEDILFEPVSLDGLMLTRYKPSPLDWWWMVLKRIFDIVFSLVFLLLFWWVYVLIAVYIWLKDGRPVIYVSQRVGKGGKKFGMYKFRTMIKDADKFRDKLQPLSERKWPLLKLSNDPRIIPWMKWLRRFSLDELPQVFNILKGEMSWVGPRPHLPSEVEQYQRWQKRLLSVPPWLTGYAQVFGRDALDFDQEARLDLWYIQNWSLWLDLYIILLTFKAIAKWH